MLCIFMQSTRVFMQPLRLPQEMAAEIRQSVSRRAAIVRIIRETTVRNQEELVKALHKQGIEATQSSVSRDLRELGVAKAGDHYILAAE